MLRLSGFLSILLAISAGALLFWASQSVQQVEKRLSLAEKNLERENESLRVLVAEWDYLNRPERLEKLITSNVDIDQDNSANQKILKRVKDIPEPVVPVLPGHKPKNLLHMVSVNKKYKRRLKKLQQDRSENFQDVIDSATEMDAQ